ncbi:broad specificity phosphatase PhoE [Deinococcus metalli]|uniref:Broad specificity phosphatase PhoE n=1 Tax=Deinococcus metalli TaxID=1141878 RepID=A0A7W8NMI0_9DEIO|nr:histidine phosphatase family protein [Deinococcus metalli]MBB5375829.1 broad specificity phosphatase PhoE [Deinococcus metalli]GHF36727.1 phosphoglycerate mutase [Deinococcus metalli]
MSELLLVRHGQATPFEADTDRLSPLGEAQARAVGDALRADGVRPTHVLHGALVRQRRTADLAAALEWPAPALDARLSEYDGDGLVNVLAPLLAARDPVVARLAATFRAAAPAERNRAFQTYLEAVAAGWQAGTLTHPDVEDWATFRARVRAALDDLLRLPSGSTVLAFTSGGVIGLTVALALDAPDTTALALNWRVKNGSVTRLTFGRGRVSLDSFNEVHHLPPDRRSWR